MGESTIGIPVRDEPPQGGLRSLVRRVGQVDEIGVIGALIILIVLLALRVPETFLTAQNFINVSRQASYVGIMAVGMVFVIAMGDIDLSVGSIWMLSSVMMAIALRDDYSIWIAVAICMVVATLCGLLNGYSGLCSASRRSSSRSARSVSTADWGWSSPTRRRFRVTTWIPGSSNGSVAAIPSLVSGSASGSCWSSASLAGFSSIARPSAGGCRPSAATGRRRSSPVSASRAPGSWL